MAKKKEVGFNEVTLKNGKKSYRTEIMLCGKRFRKTFPTLKLAKTWKNHMLSNISENKANGINYLNGMYFEDLCMEFLKTRIGTKDSTKKSYQSTISTHLLMRFGKRPIKTISKNDMVSLQGALEKLKHEPGGINKITQLFSSILDFGVKMEYMERNPLKGTKRLKVDSQNYQYWTAKQALKFLSHPETRKNHYFNVFKFFLNTGLRRGEVCGLLWENVNIEGNKGFLKFNKQLNPDMTRDLVKGHTFRTPQLSPVSINILLSIPRDPNSEYVFKTEKGEPIPPNKMSKLWREAQVKAGFKKTIKLHAARHSFASFLASKGESITKIQHLLGHKDSKVTERYSHLNKEDERKAVKIVDFGGDIDKM